MEELHGLERLALDTRALPASCKGWAKFSHLPESRWSGKRRNLGTVPSDQPNPHLLVSTHMVSQGDNKSSCSC